MDALLPGKAVAHNFFKSGKAARRLRYRAIAKLTADLPVRSASNSAFDRYADSMASGAFSRQSRQHAIELSGGVPVLNVPFRSARNRNIYRFLRNQSVNMADRSMKARRSASSPASARIAGSSS